ncbi:uncharacterized protein LOC143259959 [Megalopta genalis]|uniref:uncharacterized protein LOC143259959 n=1 Tax=Megalopta genalis TaxID=115081 RepID=UPI003FD1F4E4
MHHDNEYDDDDTEMATKCEDAKACNPYDFRLVDEEINDIKVELAKSRKEYQSVEEEIREVCRLKDKGLFILKDKERKYKELESEMNEIHNDYMKCVEKVNSYEKNVQHKIESLTLLRANLKQELEELQKRADENGRNLADIKRRITVQEKKNIALLRRLKKMAGKKTLTEDLKERINAALRDPRITGTNISNQNTV